MLVLTREVPEEARGDRQNEIVLTTADGSRIVLRMFRHNRARGKVAVGIEAPAAVHILRGELEKVAA